MLSQSSYNMRMLLAMPIDMPGDVLVGVVALCGKLCLNLGAFLFYFFRETTNLENRILHDRGGCRRNCGGETGASPPT